VGAVLPGLDVRGVVEEDYVAVGADEVALLGTGMVRLEFGDLPAEQLAPELGDGVRITGGEGPRVT